MAGAPVPPISIAAPSVDNGHAISSAAAELSQRFGGIDKSGISNATLITVAIVTGVVVWALARNGPASVICEPMWQARPTISSEACAAAWTASSSASAMATPNLLSRSPVARYGWVSGSMSGLTRKAMRAT